MSNFPFSAAIVWFSAVPSVNNGRLCSKTPDDWIPRVDEPSPGGNNRCPDRWGELLRVGMSHHRTGWYLLRQRGLPRQNNISPGLSVEPPENEVHTNFFNGRITVIQVHLWAIPSKYLSRWKSLYFYSSCAGRWSNGIWKLFRKVGTAGIFKLAILITKKYRCPLQRVKMTAPRRHTRELPRFYECGGTGRQAAILLKSSPFWPIFSHFFSLFSDGVQSNR